VCSLTGAVGEEFNILTNLKTNVLCFGVNFENDFPHKSVSACRICMKLAFCQCVWCCLGRLSWDITYFNFMQSVDYCSSYGGSCSAGVMYLISLIINVFFIQFRELDTPILK
jgi:hypothetical protein